jgi:hypothetical protein
MFCLLFTGCATVTFVADPGGKIVGEERQYVLIGDDAEQVYARANEGFYFVKWVDDKAPSPYMNNPLMLKNLREDKLIVAKFAPKQMNELSVIKNNKESINIANINEPNKIKYFTSTTPERIQILIINRSQNPYITQKIEGAVANAGYEVITSSLYSAYQNTSPYLTLVISNGYNVFDKMGNYYIYEGEANITIKRSLKNVEEMRRILAETTIKAKSDRKLGEKAAIENLTKKLTQKSVEFVISACNREMQSIKAVKITLPKAVIRKAFGSDLRNEEAVIDEVLIKMRRLPGIYSISLSKSTTENITFEAIYSKKEFPNGLIHNFLDGEINFSTSDHIDEFMRYLFKI